MKGLYNLKEFFYTGVMGSGKSEKLINMVDELPKHSFIVLNASLDGSTGEKSSVNSRNGKSVVSTKILSSDNVADIRSILFEVYMEGNIVNIFVDEIQFLTIEQIKFIHDYSTNVNVNIFYFGLKTDFKGDLFESVEYLLNDIVSEDDIFTIERECEEPGCKNIAKNNARIINDEIIHSGDLFAEEKTMYKSLCDFHFFS